MNHRIDYSKASPEGYKAFGGVYVTVQKSGLPQELINLVYLRVSQINGCDGDRRLHGLEGRRSEEPPGRWFESQAVGARRLRKSVLPFFS